MSLSPVADRPPVVPVRRGPLSDGQLAEWWKHQTPGPNPTVNFRLRPPAPISPQQAVAALELLVERHEALRTTISLGPDGHPVQEVHPAGQRPLRVERYDAGADRTELHKRLWANDLDVTRDWPCWVCLICAPDGTVVELYIVVSHTVIDGIAAQVLRRELEEVLAAGGEERAPRLPPVDSQQLDVVADERAPTADAGREAARRYWREVYRRAPTALFRSDRYDDFQLYEGELRSASAPAVFAAGARRFRVTPGVLYASLLQVVLSKLSGSRRVALRSHYSGRGTRTGWTVGCFHRILLTTVDMSDGPPLSELTRRVSTEVLLSQRRSQIDNLSLREIEAREEQRRGAAFGSGVTVNFSMGEDYPQRYPDPGYQPVADDAGDEPRLRLAPADFRAEDTSGMVAYLMACFSLTELEVIAGFNADVITPEEMRVILTGPEELLRGALRDGDLSFAEMQRRLDRPHLPVRSYGPVVQHSLAQPSQIEQVLLGHPDVVAGHVYVADGSEGGPARLVALLASASGRLTPRAVRDHVLRGLSPTCQVVCPQQFVIYPGAPAHPADRTAWAELTPLVAGSGMDHVPVAESAAYQALGAAVRRYTGVTDLSPHDTYLAAGGSLVLVPALLRELTEAGFGGLQMDDFARPISLAGLAAAMAPLAGA